MIPRPSEKIWQRDWLRAVILVALIGASIFMSAQLFVANGPVLPGHFSYLQDIPLTGGSLQVANVNGLVTLSTWSGNQALINGTIVPTGVGATPDQVNLQVTNSNGLISISATYPTPTNGRSYELDLGVFLPSASNLTTISISSTFGPVQISNLQVSHANVYTATGSVSLKLQTVTLTGSYSISTDTGGITLEVPSTSAFQLSATSNFSHIWASGLNNCQVQSSEWNTFIHVGQSLTANCGDGLASFTASTHSGDVTVNRV